MIGVLLCARHEILFLYSLIIFPSSGENFSSEEFRIFFLAFQLANTTFMKENKSMEEGGAAEVPSPSPSKGLLTADGRYRIETHFSARVATGRLPVPS